MKVPYIILVTTCMRQRVNLLLQVKICVNAMAEENREHTGDSLGGNKILDFSSISLWLQRVRAKDFRR